MAKQSFTRRNFGKVVAGTLATTAVGYPVLKYNSPEPYDLALLKMDTTNDALALVHRRCATGDRQATVEPGKASFDGLDARTLAADGHESLVISPELCIAADTNGAENINQHQAKLTNCPQSIYIPYHLFEDARSFDVRVKKNGEGQWRLCIEIAGVPQASKVPILKAAANAVVNGVENTGSGIGDRLAQGFAWVEDKMGVGENNLASVQQQQHASADAYEKGRPHPYSEALFSLEMDYVPGKVPNLLFFNGHTLDNPSYCLRGEKIEQGIRTDRDFNFPIIPNDGVNITDGVGQSGIPVPLYRNSYKFFSPELARKVEDAKLLTDSTPEAGYIPEILHYLSRKTLEDDKINGYEMGSLAIAARTEQRALDEIGKDSMLDKLGIRFGLRHQDKFVPQELPGAGMTR